jgi:hypothetical protein
VQNADQSPALRAMSDGLSESAPELMAGSSISKTSVLPFKKG